MSMSSTTAPRGLVPDREPGSLRARDAGPGRRAVAGHRRSPRRGPGLPVTRRVEAGAARRVVDPPADARRQQRDPECVGVIAWMHTFSPAKMWIAGLDALQKPLLHLHTQAGVELPWSTIDMDFMNLNQAAHGDREFGYIQSRLGVAAQDRRRSRRVARASPQRDRRTGPAPRWAATSCAPQARALRRQHARRRRHRGRQGRGAAALRRLGQHLRRQRPGRRRSTRSPTPTSTSSSTEYADTYAVAPELLPGGDRHESLRVRRPHRARPARVPHRGRLRRLHHQLRGPRRAPAAARPRRAAADGRRLRLRRRGRLEDVGAAARR